MYVAIETRTSNEMARFQFDHFAACIVMIGGVAGMWVLALLFHRLTVDFESIVAALTAGALTLGIFEYVRARRKPPGSKG